MSSVQEIWHNKADEEILEAATCLDEYAEEARQAIITEAKHRDLNVAPLIEATAKIQGTPKKTGELPAFLVRLLGLYWVISGASGMISNGLDTAWLYRTSLREGFDFFPATSLAWFIGDCALLSLGIFLIVKHEKILGLLTPQADPENRAPCLECGEEVLHDDLHCQVCGATLPDEEGS